MPPSNAERTIRSTYDAIPHDIVDEVIVTDDASPDKTDQVHALRHVRDRRGVLFVAVPRWRLRIATPRIFERRAADALEYVLRSQADPSPD